MTSNYWRLQQTPEMDTEQFSRWQNLLEERTGMQLSVQRKTFLETSLFMRMRELGNLDYDSYYQQLVSGLAGEVEWATLVDRLTVQETCFFRHQSSFQLVEAFCREHLRQSPEEQMHLWSVGCSTGEEPYSLAMLLDNLIQQQAKSTLFGITATDLSLPALRKARAGIYKAARLVGQVPEDWLKSYFEPVAEHRLQVIQRLRERICFAQVNVKQLDKAPMTEMHLIYCQNLLIYFRRWRQREIVSRLIERLLPGGLLVLGVGEVIEFEHPLAQRKVFDNTLAYTRIDA